MSPAINLVSFVSERSRRTIIYEITSPPLKGPTGQAVSCRSRTRRYAVGCRAPQKAWLPIRTCRSPASGSPTGFTAAHNGCARNALLVLGVEKRAVAVERCKRAPNVLDADFGRAQLGINQRWRKSTGDIVSSKPEMKAGPRHFWARNQFSDHASRRRAARRYARRTCNYDPLTGFHSVNRSGEDTQGSSEILNQLGLQPANGVAPIGLDPPFCGSATLSEIGVRASRITRTDRTGTLHTRGSQRQGLAAFPSS